MNSIKNCDSNPSENSSCSSNERAKIVFTIRDGSLLVTSKNDVVSKSALTGFQCLPFKNSKSKEEGEGEIYIEIIRDDVEQYEEYPINNISSSYGAFWKGDFESCIDRRTCIECKHVLFTPHQLLHHMQNTHNIQNPNECFVCHKLFSNGSESNNHMKQVHHFERPDVTCEACFKVFDSESDKNIHRTRHSERLNCKWCSEPFPCEYLLNYHLRNCSLRRIDLDCHICGCQFRSSHILQLHSLRHNRNSCELCQYSPLNVADALGEDAAVSLVKHLKNCHTQEEIDSILKKLKIQDEEEETLDKLFMSQIEENLNQLSDSIPQNCADDPQKEQSWEISLDNQQEIISRHAEASLQCTECHKTFGSKEETVKHELTHQTPFSCSVCSLKFSHRRGFKKHMRSHGILVKPSSVRYTCRHCSVNCATLSALHTHLLIHTDEKPHLCEKCGLKFRRPNALKAHDLAVHKSRVLHHCSQCDTKSLSKSSLLRHIQCVHGGVRRFICGLCGNRCLQNQGLRRHLKSEHNLELPPMESLCKKSSMEVHVIPPPQNLSPNNPIAEILKLAIRDEKSKLEALKKLPTSEETPNNESPKLLCSESVIDGQPLNILGDVASKAAPLEQASVIPEFLQPKSQEATKFLCAECQHCSDSLNDLSLHLTRCQQGRTVFAEQDSNEVLVAKPPVVYALASSLAKHSNEVSSGIPYQLCFVPPINVGSSTLGPVSVCNNSSEQTVVPSINVSTSVSLPQASRNLLATSISSTSLSDISKNNVDNNMESTENLVPVTEFNGGSRLPIDIMSLNVLDTSNTSQLEFLDASNFIFQEDFLIREETCKIYDLNEPSASFTTSNAVSLNDGRVESLKEQSSPYNCPKTMLLGADGMKVSQLLSSGLEVVSPNLPDNPKALNDSASCFLESTPPELVSSLPTLPATNCGTVVQPDENQTHCSPENLKIMQICKKAKTDSTNPIDGERNSLKSEIVKSASCTEEKANHVCPECGKQLSSASTFKRHLEIHFGGKPHICSYCDKCFRYKHNLTVHIRSHTGVRPFDCPTCKRKFRYLSELNEHRLSHSGSKSFSCPECGQQFARQRDLRRHSLSHRQSEKPTCDICQKIFSRVDYLRRHIKAHKSSAIMDGEESSSLKTARNQVMKKSGTQDKIQAEVSHSLKNIPSGSIKSVPESYKSRKANSTLVVKDCTSDDLISLAYQAAEDGVEFMFVEEVNACAYEQDIEVTSSEVEGNFMLIKTWEQI
ncbi:uncharacterized protein LOC117639064 isoform X2 [Thrips palmi]|uniref:Uncharacterized protein LOC117639064 isoform X2 n=1 Tax=Thrips palmi TaxID=161013 RepID=A0A6P8XTU6_THRPL|nr:uncharacterized protein LOC117639064 isoform X2 [Thrips palmi]